MLQSLQLNCKVANAFPLNVTLNLLSLSLIHTRSLSLAQTLTLSLSLLHTHSRSLSHIQLHWLMPSDSLALIHSPTLSNTYSLSLTVPHTLSLSHTHSLDQDLNGTEHQLLTSSLIDPFFFRASGTRGFVGWGGWRIFHVFGKFPLTVGTIQQSKRARASFQFTIVKQRYFNEVMSILIQYSYRCWL